MLGYDICCIKLTNIYHLAITIYINSNSNTISMQSQNSYKRDYFYQISTKSIKYIAICQSIESSMSRLLSKISSASKLAEIQQSTPSNKIRKTIKRVQTEQASITSQKPQSIISQNHPQKRYISPKTSHIRKEQAGKSSTQLSQMSDAFPSSISNELKSQFQSTTPTSKFIRKPSLALRTESIQYLEKKSKNIVSPKFNNKNIKEAILEEGSQAPEMKVFLKKMDCVFTILSRIYKSKLLCSINYLRENKRRRKLNQRQGTLLIYSLSQFWNRLQKKYKLEAVNRLKQSTAKNNKQVFLVENELIRINIKKRKDFLVKCLHNLYRSKSAFTFMTLKKYMLNRRLLSKVYPALFNFYQKRRVRNTFQSLKQFINANFSLKDKLLHHLEKSFTNCRQVGLRYAFQRLIFNSTFKLYQQQQEETIIQNEQLNEKAVLFKAQIKQNQKQINQLNQNINKKQIQIENQSNILKRQIEGLKQSNLQINRQNNQKTVQIPQPAQKGDDFLQIKLQHLYCNIDKLPQQETKQYIQKFINECKAVSNTQVDILRQWSLIQQKEQLQKQIDCYQNQILGPNKRKRSQMDKLLRQQNTMLKQMIQNYIKQRYLWGQVKKFISFIK